MCALNITKDCGADQLDHEEDPVVGAVVLNQHQQYIDIEYMEQTVSMILYQRIGIEYATNHHQQYIDIEYGTNRQHDITSTYVGIEYATNHHQQYMDLPQTITMTTLQRLFLG